MWVAHNDPMLLFSSGALATGFSNGKWVNYEWSFFWQWPQSWHNHAQNHGIGDSPRRLFWRKIVLRKSAAGRIGGNMYARFRFLAYCQTIVVAFRKFKETLFYVKFSVEFKFSIRITVRWIVKSQSAICWNVSFFHKNQPCVTLFFPKKMYIFWEKLG